MFVCGITLALRSEIENSILYAIIILMGVLYSNVRTILELYVKTN